MRISRTSVLTKTAAAAAAFAIAGSVIVGAGPAAAGGYYGGGVLVGGYGAPYGFYGPRYSHRPYAHVGYRHRFRHGFRRGYSYRGGVSGVEATLIAAGIIGGVILIDNTLDENARRRRLDRYRYGALSGGDLDDGRDGGWALLERERRFLREDRRRLDQAWKEFERRTGKARPAPDAHHDAQGLEDEARAEPVEPKWWRQNIQPRREEKSDGLDDQLLGGASARRIRSSFAACAAEARAAATAGDLLAALPAEPGDVRELAGGAVRMKAAFTVREIRGAGAQYRKTMDCEVDERGVRFLEII